MRTSNRAGTEQRNLLVGDVLHAVCMESALLGAASPVYCHSY